MIIGERIETLLNERGWSQAELARRVGVSQQTIWKLISGGSRQSKYLVPIARALRTTPEYLMGETDDPASNKVGEAQQTWNGPPAEKSDVVELPQFDLAYGMGSSFIHDVPVTGVSRSFSRAWLRQFTESPIRNLFWASGIGDSMMPTIQDADVVLVDTAIRTPEMWDKIWALEMGGMGMIKRLRPTKDGTGIRLLSDGGQPEEIAYDGEMNVIGRVVAIARKI